MWPNVRTALLTILKSASMQYLRELKCTLYTPRSVPQDPGVKTAHGYHGEHYTTVMKEYSNGLRIAATKPFPYHWRVDQ